MSDRPDTPERAATSGAAAWTSALPELSWATAAPQAASDGRERPDLHALLVRAGLPAFAVEAKAEHEPLTLVVNDPHRYTDTRSFIDAVFAALDALPVVGARPAVRVLVAAGTHKIEAFERAAHEERIAAPYLSRIAEIEWHDADTTAEHVSIGDDRFHRWFAGHGFFVACGSMEPHYFAGVTGGHKTLTVGVMARASIERNHKNALSDQARPLALEGNPVHEGIASSLRALEARGAHLLALNEVIAGGNLVAATAGHPLEALRDGLSAVRCCFARRVEKPVDLVVARVEPPLDRDLYQADKGIKNTEAAVRDGGVLVVEAACKNGVGIDHFVELLQAARSYENALAVVERRGYRLGDHKAVRLRALTDRRRVRVALVSPHVDRALGPTLGMTIFSSRDEAVAWVREQLGGASSGAALFVEDAGNIALEVGA